MNSITEAAHAGIPMIIIPLFGDQNINAISLKNKGVAEITNIEEADNEFFTTEALTKVLNSKIYTENAKILYNKLNSYPIDPIQNFVKWVEFSAKFPNFNELNLPLPLEVGGIFIYYSIDIILASFIILCLIVVIFCYLFKKVNQLMFKNLLNKLKTE